MAKRTARQDAAYDEPIETHEALGPDPARAGGAVMGFAWLLALGWVGGAVGAIVAVLGVGGVLLQPPAILAAGAFGILLPALLVLFAGAAAREGARGRAQAAMLATAAQRLLSPAEGSEAAARRLGVAVRGEIAALDRALDQALHKVRDVEAVIARQTLSVDQAAGAAQAGARHMITGLERERAELQQISEDLHNHAGMIGEAIGRHTRLIADAARLAESEVRSADEALDARLSSFGAAAALISDRTHALTSAAQASADSALRLENALSDSLDALAQATKLTDAARQSAEAATFAANSTAGAVRETTQRAVEEAKRAAEQIRAEALSVERAGHAALERLRETANLARDGFAEARHSAPEPRRAPEPPAAREPERTFDAPPPRREPPRPAAPPTRVGNDFAESLSQPTPPPAPRREEPSRPPQRRESDGARWTWREVLAAIDENETPANARATDAPARGRNDAAPTPPPITPPSQRGSGQDQRPPAAPSGRDSGRMSSPFFADRLRNEAAAPRSEAPPPARDGWGFGGRETPPPARDPSPALRGFEAEEPRRPAPALEPEAGRGLSRGAPEPATSQAPGMAILHAAGIRIGEVFGGQALDRIAQKARGGTQSRRRAVRDAAADAVLQLAEHLDGDTRARAEAAAFLKQDGARISELLGRGRADLGADATRIFLLLDAAAT